MVFKVFINHATNENLIPLHFPFGAENEEHIVT